MSLPRICEVCGHKWKSKFGYIWILICPACKTSGYHQPKEPLLRAEIDHSKAGKP